MRSPARFSAEAAENRPSTRSARSGTFRCGALWGRRSETSGTAGHSATSGGPTSASLRVAAWLSVGDGTGMGAGAGWGVSVMVQSLANKHAQLPPLPSGACCGTLPASRQTTGTGVSSMLPNFTDVELSEMLRTMTLGRLEFRRFGISCCRRIIGCFKHAGLRKALRRLEESARADDDQLRRDALNAAHSIYLELGRARIKSSTGTPADREVSAACTLVCAAELEPNGNLLGNFRRTLEQAEGVTFDEARGIEVALLRSVLSTDVVSDAP